jgi:hypothetical protein
MVTLSALADRIPQQPGRDHLLRYQRHPAQHHRWAGPGRAQGAVACELTAARSRAGDAILLTAPAR